MAPLHPPLPSTAAVKYRAWMLQHFPAMADWGSFSCRHIAGSASWSQHAWANAWDLHPPNKEYGDRAAAAIRANASSLAVAHLLWQVPDHFDHIHADFTPQGIGTPPCAGGALHWAGSATVAGSGPCPPGQTLVFIRERGRYECQGIPGGGIAKIPGQIVGAAEAIPHFLGKVPTYLKIAAGGIVLFGGLAVLIVAATGRQNKAAQMVTQRVRVPTRRPSNPSPAPKARPVPKPRPARPARPSTSGPRYVKIGGQRVEASRLSPKARRQLEG